MANYEAQETAKISVTTSDKSANFAMGFQECYLTCDADCFVDFDRPAMTTSSLLLKANLQPTRIVFAGGNVGSIHAITASSTANLYILVTRGK